jgi:hypothetical protein
MLLLHVFIYGTSIFNTTLLGYSLGKERANKIIALER